MHGLGFFAVGRGKCVGMWYACAMHRLKFFAMGRGNFVGFWFAYAWAQILCYVQW